MYFRKVDNDGYRLDPETGLYLVRFRHYHPTLGRWISRDPVHYFDSLNMYEYVYSRPETSLDPHGLFERYSTTIVAKSYIGRVGTNIGTLDFDQTDSWLQGMGLFTDAVFSENPLTAEVGYGYRMRTERRIKFCCDNGKIKEVKFGKVEDDVNDEDFGLWTWKVKPGAVYGVKQEVGEDRATFEWSYKGLPAFAAEMFVQFLQTRNSGFIWHTVKGVVYCEGDKGYYNVQLSGSRFPSHRLWVDDVLKKTIKQGPLSALWKSDPDDPTKVK